MEVDVFSIPMDVWDARIAGNIILRDAVTSGEEID